VSVSVNILLNYGQLIEVGEPWLGLSGDLNIALRFPTGDLAASIQGTPEDMDRLAEAARTAAAQARATEPELRAKREQDGGR
jgi:hypothetical protein